MPFCARSSTLKKRFPREMRARGEKLLYVETPFFTNGKAEENADQPARRTTAPCSSSNGGAKRTAPPMLEGTPVSAEAFVPASASRIVKTTPFGTPAASSAARQSAADRDARRRENSSTIRAR